MAGPHGLMLCPGHAPATPAMVHDMSGMDMSGMDMSGMDMSGMHMHASDAGHGAPTPDENRPEVCPFAAAATAMVAFHAPVAVVHSHFLSTELILPAQPVVPRGTIVPTRLPRGPPLYS